MRQCRPSAPTGRVSSGAYSHNWRVSRPHIVSYAGPLDRGSVARRTGTVCDPTFDFALGPAHCTLPDSDGAGKLALTHQFVNCRAGNPATHLDLLASQQSILH